MPVRPGTDIKTSKHASVRQIPVKTGQIKLVGTNYSSICDVKLFVLFITLLRYLSLGCSPLLSLSVHYNHWEQFIFLMCVFYNLSFAS